MAKAIAHPKFEKEIRNLPPEIRAWAANCIDAIQSQTAAQIAAKASKLRHARALWAVKKRGKPHGEYRLIFEFVEAETVVLLGCGSRQDAYKKIPRRRPPTGKL